MNHRRSSRKIITPEHIELIMGVDEQAAEREYDYVRNFLGVDHEQFTIKSFCKHSGLILSEIKSFLFPVKRSSDKIIKGQSELSDDADLELNI